MLKYIYYKYYKFSIAVGNGEIAKFQAIVMLVLVVILNIITVLGYLDVLFQITFAFSKILKVVIGVMLFVISYLYFHYKSDHIIEKFSNESRKQKKIGNVLITFYSILSLVLLFGSWYLMFLRNIGQL